MHMEAGNRRKVSASPWLAWEQEGATKGYLSSARGGRERVKRCGRGGGSGPQAPNEIQSLTLSRTDLHTFPLPSPLCRCLSGSSNDCQRINEGLP